MTMPAVMGDLVTDEELDALKVETPYGAAAVWGCTDKGVPLVRMIYPGPPIPLTYTKTLTISDGPHATKCPSCGTVIVSSTRSGCNAAARAHKH